MDRGPYFIHQVIFQSKMRQLTKHSELEILRRRGICALRDAGPSELYKLSATVTGLAGSPVTECTLQLLQVHY